MGEKGNLVDISEEVFANLAEQGPQFWIAYEQYKLARDKVEQAGVRAPAGPQAYGPSGGGIDPPAEG
jgi:hypothetical protein